MMPITVFLLYTYSNYLYYAYRHHLHDQNLIINDQEKRIQQFERDLQRTIGHLLKEIVVQVEQLESLR